MPECNIYSLKHNSNTNSFCNNGLGALCRAGFITPTRSKSEISPDTFICWPNSFCYQGEPFSCNPLMDVLLFSLLCLLAQLFSKLRGWKY